MIPFKYYSRYKLLNEAISLKTAKEKKLSKKYSGAYYSEELDSIFNKKDRIFYPIKIENIMTEKHKPYGLVRDFFKV